ncbi:hypothetical protein MBLNU230_g3108t1 [Neophaeotheca triangularis]
MSTTRDSTPISYHSSPTTSSSSRSELNSPQPSHISASPVQTHREPLKANPQNQPQQTQPQPPSYLRRRHSHPPTPSTQSQTNQDQTSELLTLRRTQARLTTTLRDTTSRCSRLHTRTKIQEAENLVSTTLMEQAREERELLRLEKEKLGRWIWGLLGVVILVGLGLGVYGGVCWVWGPEMEYVRRRRGEVLGV